MLFFKIICLKMHQLILLIHNMLIFLIHLKITVLLMRQGLQRNVSYPILVCKWLARMRVMKSGQGYLTMDQCLYLSNQVHIWPQICPLWMNSSYTIQIICYVNYPQEDADYLTRYLLRWIPYSFVTPFQLQGVP